ncbi:hypothetical protein ACEK07_46670 [Alcanivoracaceae bacterium MT1]
MARALIKRVFKIVIIVKVTVVVGFVGVLMLRRIEAAVTHVLFLGHHGIREKITALLTQKTAPTAHNLTSNRTEERRRQVGNGAFLEKQNRSLWLWIKSGEPHTDTATVSPMRTVE